MAWPQSPCDKAATNRPTCCTEAQQAYFRAYNAEQDNPDILYNLAISLEHMRQNKLAAQYYALAVAAAQNHRSSFDPAQAAARLQILQR